MSTAQQRTAEMLMLTYQHSFTAVINSQQQITAAHVDGALCH